MRLRFELFDNRLLERFVYIVRTLGLPEGKDGLVERSYMQLKERSVLLDGLMVKRGRLE